MIFDRNEKGWDLVAEDFDLIIQTDGASRGNPGQAGTDIVFLAPDGQVLRTFGRYLGQTTNNAAEYTALIDAISEAHRSGARRVKILSDSELMVKQIRGEYRLKSPSLQPLFTKAIGLLRRFDRWRIEHIPRSENRRADGIANRSIDER